jgi:hypothetical protein
MNRGSMPGSSKMPIAPGRTQPPLLGDKRPGREVQHSPPSSAKVDNA